MKDKFTIVYDWMLDLGLSITQLLCFAIIYGFSADGIGAFTGSRAYLTRKMGSKSKRTADKALLNLIGLGLIIKIEKTRNGIKFCEYRVAPEHIPACATDATNVDTGANITVGDGADRAHKSKQKKNKESISPSNIAREVCPDFGEEFYSLVETLSTETQWRNKSEAQWIFNLRRLAKVPEIEACEMVRKTIERGWKGFWELKPEEKALLHGSKNSSDTFHAGNNPTPPRKGISVSEAIVKASLEHFYS